MRRPSRHALRRRPDEPAPEQPVPQRPAEQQLEDMRQTIAEHRAFLAVMGLEDVWASWQLGARQLLAARKRRRNSGSPPGTPARFRWQPTVTTPPGPYAPWPDRIAHHRPSLTDPKERP